MSVNLSGTEVCLPAATQVGTRTLASSGFHNSPVGNPTSKLSGERICRRVVRVVVSGELSDSNNKVASNA